MSHPDFHVNTSFLTVQAYPQGNYEVVSARCAAGSGELLVDSALKQLHAHFDFQNQKVSSSQP